MNPYENPIEIMDFLPRKMHTHIKHTNSAHNLKGLKDSPNHTQP